jgi:PAS domain S-box-containing protein
MLALNEKGKITLINQKGNQVLGYQEDELIGKSWFDTCLPEKNRKKVRQVFGKLMSGEIESLDYYENPVLTKSGEERIIAWYNTVITDEEGNNIGTLSSGEDITKEKRTEELLNAINQASIAMSTAFTRREIFDAVVKELKRLNISCFLMQLNEKQSEVFFKYMSYDPSVLAVFEKLTRTKQEEYSIPIDAIDFIKEVVREKKTLYTTNTEDIIRQLLPKGAKKFSTQIVKTLNNQRTISSPLLVNDQVIGVFSIQSNNLSPEDVPATTAFAHQLAGAWEKTALIEDLRNTLEGTINTIAGTVEARDPYTAGHQERVADLAVTIATEMQLSEDQIEGIRLAGIIHDLGKIQVPAEILSKPGTISELEYELVKTHPQVGSDLLNGVSYPWPLCEMVLQHHEKMDGSGYPQGLKGDEIIIEARILAVADIVEAMASHRPYREALGINVALYQIEKDKGTLFDSKVVDACLKVFEQGYKFPKI